MASRTPWISPRRLWSLAAATVLLGAASTSLAVDELPTRATTLSAPERLRAGDEYVDTEIGHAAPYIADFDRDGKLDLLVGQFGEGKLRIYKNTGTNSVPEYAKHRYFQIDKQDVKVPTG